MLGLLMTVMAGFLLGMTVPVVASRFGKILPADAGTVLWTVWHKPVFPKNKANPRFRVWRFKLLKFLSFSVAWGIFMSLLFAALWSFVSPNLIFWAGGLLYVTALCMTIDQQYFLLPDFFTLPLLLAGFSFALFTGELTPANSLWGAVFAYVISMLAVLAMMPFKKYVFGAGDAKMMTALGAWFGYEGLNFMLIVSFVFFALESLFYRRTAGAFGPALGLAAFVTFFLLYAN